MPDEEFKTQEASPRKYRYDVHVSFIDTNGNHRLHTAVVETPSMQIALIHASSAFGIEHKHELKMITNFCVTLQESAYKSKEG